MILSFSLLLGSSEVGLFALMTESKAFTWSFIPLCFVIWFDFLRCFSLSLCVVPDRLELAFCLAQPPNSAENTGMCHPVQIFLEALMSHTFLSQYEVDLRCFLPL